MGLVAELRGTVDFPSVRWPTVSRMNDVEWSASCWRATPCFGASVLPIALVAWVPGEAAQASRDRSDHATSTMTQMDRTLHVQR